MRVFRARALLTALEDADPGKIDLSQGTNTVWGLSANYKKGGPTCFRPPGIVPLFRFLLLFILRIYRCAKANGQKRRGKMSANRVGRAEGVHPSENGDSGKQGQGGGRTHERMLTEKGPYFFLRA